MQRSLTDFMVAKGGAASSIPTSATAAAAAKRSNRSAIRPTVVVDADATDDDAPAPKRSRSRSASSSPPRHLSRPDTANSGLSHECSCRWLPQLLTDEGWRTLLAPMLSDRWRNGQLCRIEQFLDAEQRAGKVVLPPRADIFSAFNSTPLHTVKVVLLGQDPYHDIGQAHGLCFSVRPGVRVPPSLQNMYKELAVDVPGFVAPRHGYLQSWAEQGILMINATLTVEAHKANAHAKCGWQDFTDDVIKALSAPQQPRRIVFLLWGNFARKKKALIDTRKHLVIENAHPSPLSARAWFGCRCFSKCNEALKELGHTPIDWSLPADPGVGEGGTRK